MLPHVQDAKNLVPPQKSSTSRITADYTSQFERPSSDCEVPHPEGIRVRDDARCRGARRGERLMAWSALGTKTLQKLFPRAESRSNFPERYFFRHPERKGGTSPTRRYHRVQFEHSSSDGGADRMDAIKTSQRHPRSIRLHFRLGRTSARQAGLAFARDDRL